MKIIYKETNESRLDKYLSMQNIETLYSRTYINKLIKKKNITVNGKAVKKSHLLSFNDEIEIKIPESKPFEVLPQNLNLNVIYEDEYLAVVEKPPFMVVHPAKGHLEGTFANGLRHQIDNLSNVNPFRPGIVHRLDKDTSGMLIVAKNNKVHADLQAMFKAREITKFYRLITVGIPSETEGVIDTNLGISKSNPLKRAVVKDGKKAITKFKLLEKFDFFSYVEVELITGRTHQIRVHFSHINCPVFGDKTYNSKKRTNSYVPVNLHKRVSDFMKNKLNRQLLHAYKLGFKHPVTKEYLEFVCDIPKDFKTTINWLKNNFQNY